MAFFVQLGQDPYRNQAGQLGQALSQGLGVRFQRGQMQQQQGQLANALFGQNANQFSHLPLDAQLKVAQFQQDQQQNKLKQQENAATLQQQKNVADQLFPDQADLFARLPVQQQVAVANLFAKNKDKEFRQSVISKLFPDLASPQGQSQGYNPENLSDQDIALLSSVDPNLAKIAQEQKTFNIQQKQKQQELEDQKLKEALPKKVAQQSFNSAAKLLKKGNLGLGSEALAKTLGGERAKDVAQFTSTMGGLEAMLVDMVSRGTLSNARFKYITETLLPKPGDRDKEIEGKLIALADLLGLDASELTGEQLKSSPGQKQSLEDIWK